jgi:multidrug resistance efflux pump
MTLILIAAILAIPMSYRVACDSELQPVTRRFVAAPFDGTLKTAHVEPGNVVLRNELLPTMDDREISIELRSIDADYHRAKKERDTHLAERDIAAAQLSGFDMDRLNQRKELLLHRTQNLEIRSPFDGLVLAGDLRKSEGVPLETGKTMFEIAPLEQMLVEIAIPESDIRHVGIGQTVELRLDAFPNREITGTLRRVHPRSEIRDDQHVFIGEIELANTNAQMLPGMQGQSKIVTERHALAWILFHKPYESFLMWMGW